MIAFLVIGTFQLAILGVVLVGFGYAASLRKMAMGLSEKKEGTPGFQSIDYPLIDDQISLSGLQFRGYTGMLRFQHTQITCCNGSEVVVLHWVQFQLIRIAVE